MNFSEFPQKIEIRQKPDRYAEATGLSKYGRSKLPLCTDKFQVAELNGRFLTGIDEDGYEVSRIFDTEKREEKRKEIKQLREYLERMTGKDLSGTSDFWKTFSVTISSDSPLVLNKTSPIDVIKFYALTANKYVAPSKKESSNPEYVNCKYYAYFEEVEKNEEISMRKKRDKAKSKLIEYSEDKDMLLLLGQYLEGSKYKRNLTLNTLYEMLSDYIESKETKNVERFLRAVDSPVDELNFKVTVDKALRKKIIKFKEGYFQRGSITLGKSVDDVYNKLGDPEFAMEYHSIKQELEEKE